MPIDWHDIVIKHGPMVLGTALRIVGKVEDAEDVAQETFLDASGIPDVEAVGNWGGLLRRIATFRALDRRRQLRVTLSLPADCSAKTEETALDAAVRRELAEHLRSVIASLPPREGAVFSLRYFEGQSNLQIAEILQISSGAVAAALHKVRSKLEFAVTQFHSEDKT